MKRLVLLIAALFVLALPTSALAFHHTGLPSTVCAAEAAGSPSNDNGMAKEAISAHNPAQTPPLPPVGTPGDGQGQGGESCANA
ncbi:MAG TPA: hypothetical protein VFW80_13670 [Gaiellaceae bacterium]|nr:hypothetical protein [Gaiellaceae bacterium]